MMNDSEIFDFDIETNNNTYRNLWNFYQTKLKEVSKLRFSDAKSIYYKNLEEMSMMKLKRLWAIGCNMYFQWARLKVV